MTTLAIACHPEAGHTAKRATCIAERAVSADTAPALACGKRLAEVALRWQG